MSPVRVLVSARDAGAALQNRAFVQTALRENYPFEFSVLAQEPAVRVFEGLSVPVQLVASSQIAGPEQEMIRRTFETLRPDFALIGLSGFGTGIDEAVLSYAKEQAIPSGAIQDYWGYLGSVDATAYPDVYFVLDQKAKQLTVERMGNRAAVEVTGSPKHEAYQAQIQGWTHRNSGDDVRRLVFFLQPRAVPGLVDNVALFLAAADQLDFPVSVAVKLHPADADGGFLRAMLSTRRLRVEVIGAEVPVERELARADVVATCFSSVGLDHNYMQAYSARALGTVLYLTAGEPIKRFMRDVIGAPTVPGADLGMGTSFDSADGLAAWIRRALVDDRERERYRRAVHDNLGFGQSATRRIAEFVQRQQQQHHH